MCEYVRVGLIKIANEFEPTTRGRLTAIGPKFRTGSITRQVFQCECGNFVAPHVNNVTAGQVVSCGCLFKERNGKHGNHGLSSHHLYQTWVNMLGRCHNPDHKDYRNYGARGITVCDRWRHSPENFINDMGPRPDGYSLDRIENDKGYEPSNCKWSNVTEQNNNRRNAFPITFNGKTKNALQWGRDLGISGMVIYFRIRSGWSVERALTEPVKTRPLRKATK